MTTTATSRRAGLIDVSICAGIPSRGLSEETCRRWAYGSASVHGEVVQVAQYHDPLTREVVGQKLRTKDKEFSIRGSVRGQLYGRHLWRDSGKRVVITEGEIDAMSVDQALGGRWPVVSLPNGASSARGALSANLEWLNGFDEVVLCFDMDDAGRTAIEECVGLFAPGKVKIATLPLKDANEMLKAKRVDELIRCLWDTKTYRPDGIVTAADVRDKAFLPPAQDMRWCWPSLNSWTFGRRYGEAVALGAGTGIGKTTFMTQQIAHDIAEGHRVAVFALEMAPEETVKRVAGQQARKAFHVPDGSWTQEELELAVNKLADSDALFLYDHFGSCEWEVIRERIRYLYHAHGVRVFYLDHLTALAAGSAAEVSAKLEVIAAEIGRLVKELNIWLLFVSHLNTPDGTPHEEGGRVMIRHFKGSRAIGFWSHFMIGLERDQQSDGPEVRGATVIRVLKDRYTGRSTGLTVTAIYDQETGLLIEREPESRGAQMFPDDGDEPF